MNDIPRIKKWAGYMKDQGVKPELEVYDTGMINTAKMLADEGIFETPLHIQFVMIGRTGFSATPKALLYCLDELPHDWTWSVCALGRAELPMGSIAMTLGGHVRVGFEDNIYLSRGELLKSNAQLVKRVVTIAEALNIEIAKPAEARKILGIS
jgi:3-keto-5-aminohexanoate cleavage enzyme